MHTYIHICIHAHVFIHSYTRICIHTCLHRYTTCTHIHLSCPASHAYVYICIQRHRNRCRSIDPPGGPRGAAPGPGEFEHTEKNTWRRSGTASRKSRSVVCTGTRPPGSSWRRSMASSAASMSSRDLRVSRTTFACVRAWHPRRRARRCARGGGRWMRVRFLCQSVPMWPVTERA